jgi:hypothetical protein
MNESTRVEKEPLFKSAACEYSCMVIMEVQRVATMHNIVIFTSLSLIDNVIVSVKMKHLLANRVERTKEALRRVTFCLDISALDFRIPHLDIFFNLIDVRVIEELLSYMFHLRLDAIAVFSLEELS